MQWKIPFMPYNVVVQIVPIPPNIYATTGPFGTGTGKVYKLNRATNQFDEHITDIKNWQDCCIAPNGDLWMTAWTDGIWKQTGQAGAVIQMDANAKNWFGICAAPNGDIYANVSSSGTPDSIYKSAGGVGPFTAVADTSKLFWAKMYANPVTGDIYANHFSGDVYMNPGGTGSFTGLGETTRNWYGGAGRSNGNIYAGTAYTGTQQVFKRTGGTGLFVATASPNQIWYGLGADWYGGLWAADTTDIYYAPALSDTLVATGQTSRNWSGVCGEIY